MFKCFDLFPLRPSFFSFPLFSPLYIYIKLWLERVKRRCLAHLSLECGSLDSYVSWACVLSGRVGLRRELLLRFRLLSYGRLKVRPTDRPPAAANSRTNVLQLKLINLFPSSSFGFWISRLLNGDAGNAVTAAMPFTSFDAALTSRGWFLTRLFTYTISSSCSLLPSTPTSSTLRLKLDRASESQSRFVRSVVYFLTRRVRFASLFSAFLSPFSGKDSPSLATAIDRDILRKLH